ncbi:MAG TPA: NAD-dependent epimerase/dehydratase family protein [Oligoflexia bacterium]|nr:NAD-dependent epimerase/dehydratase family protein [Oligoflexia bacterium]HMP27002.1 NAD-dependent epimerase/dehydratase family protein [Oligoflexia bacterium]
MKAKILITGAAGEIGSELAKALANSRSAAEIILLDLKPSKYELPAGVRFVTRDILDTDFLASLFEENDFEIIFHLAAILSSSGERDPMLAHRVNVEGSLNMLKLASEFGARRGEAVKFIFPSTIAVYGLSPEEFLLKITEELALSPITMYGVNKLYVEHLGRYFEAHYGGMPRLANSGVDIKKDGGLRDLSKRTVDFRSVRFPGILSAFTLPTGGTSDYAPEMIHAAARGESYTCFVSHETVLPFMAMPDAVGALLKLAAADKTSLSRVVYNVNSFSISAGEIEELLREHFDSLQVSYKPDLARQAIVNSWPKFLDDSLARREWGWRPDFNLEKTFMNYLIPNIKKYYK